MCSRTPPARDSFSTDRDGTPPVDIAPVGPRIWGFERQWAWAGARVLTWSGPDKAFLLTDPVSHRVQRIPIPDSLAQLYSPVVSPDGSELIATRMQPWGANNDLWRVRFSDGKWTPVRFDVPTNAEAQLWDESGLYVFATDISGNALYHQVRPGATPTAYLAEAKPPGVGSVSRSAPSRDRPWHVIVGGQGRWHRGNHFQPSETLERRG